MKLTLKIAFVFICAFGFISLITGYARTDERMRAIERDWKSDQELLASALVPAISRSWRLEGRDAALYTISYLNQYQERRRVRWVSLGADVKPAERPKIEESGLPREESVPIRSLIHTDERGRRYLYTYARLEADLDDAPLGLVELSTPLPHRSDVLPIVLKRELRVVALHAAVALVLVLILGAWWVGRPVSRLIAQAESVGSGDLQGRAHVAQRDELGTLARAMNRMTDRLAATKAKVEEEESAKAIALDQLRHIERVATVGELAAGVAHEIGSPLNVIQGRAALIAESEGASKEVRDNAGIVMAQVHRIADIVRGLLDYSRPRPVDKRVIDLRRVASEVVGLLDTNAKKKTLALRVEACDDPVLTYADGGQMQQVLTNLVMNAIHASESGEVVVGCTPPAEGENEVRVWVSDQGSGIAPELLDRLFDPFFTTKNIGEGTGLGLSVSYGIVEEHGGRIEVASEKGRGSRFTVRLPAAQPDG
jgi:signal transduction histidine kinase